MFAMNAQPMQQMVFNSNFQGGNPFPQAGNPFQGNNQQYGNPGMYNNNMGGGMNPNFQQGGFNPNNNNAKYKTALCNNFSSTGMCKFGDTCKFAHGMQELRRHGGGGQQHNQFNKFQNNNRGGGYQPRGMNTIFKLI